MNRLKYVKFKDFLALLQFFLVLPFALVAKIFIRRLWLIAEDENEARDNGYWLYKYIRENHPKQKIMYAINKKATDYSKVKTLGRVISYGSWSHWFWYIVSDKKISSQKGAKPNAAVCYFFEVAFPIWRSKIYFLQHGVIKDDLKWLYYKECRFKMFTTSTYDEYNYVKNNFGYMHDEVKLLGLCRFDNFFNSSVVDKQKILVMPSWREYIARDSIGNKITEEKFLCTEYYQKWQEFLNDSTLIQYLNNYDKTLTFYPHRNMQKFINTFSSCSDRIIIASSEQYDVQHLLMESALLITDFSSVFFDFAYLNKPVLFYQFDEEEFRSKQYSQGYFDYRNNSIGKQCCCLQTLNILLKNVLDNNFELGSCEQSKNVFFAQDNKNCERTYYAIKGS